MYIHEAITTRDSDHPYITRERWQKDWAPDPPKLLAANPHIGLGVVSNRKKRLKEPPRFGWQPAVEDLIADDWKPVD